MAVTLIEIEEFQIAEGAQPEKLWKEQSLPGSPPKDRQ